MQVFRVTAALLFAVALAGCSSGSNGASGQGGSGAGGSGAGSGSGGSGAATGSGGSGAGNGSGGSSGGGCTVGASETGDGTYYAADGSGNCGFDPSPNDLMVAAMNDPDYAASAVCGECVHVKGPSGEVTVRIVDRCPECKHGDLDLSPQAFAKLADPKLGRVTIHWTPVACDVQGPIRYRFKEGANQWWTAVQVRNHRYAIAKFEYQKAGKWVAVPRESYNYFVEASGMGPGPYSFRVADVKGHVLTDQNIPLKVAAEVAGAAQFPGCP
jgi:expansin (peptidoglycan-binding protein)